MSENVSIIDKLIGTVVKEIHVPDEKSPLDVLFVLENGSRFWMYHPQDCCEDAWLEDVIGEWADIIGCRLLMAEKVTRDYDWDKDPATQEWLDTSATWTFYKFATVHGYVTLRWIGTSNGYYSEEVYIEEVAKDFLIEELYMYTKYKKNVAIKVHTKPGCIMGDGE